jgi:superfamily I DNA and/or RNA helicase
MDVCVSEVRSYDKLTCEGMTLLGSHIEDAVGEVVEEAGGCPDDFQFWETHDKIGLAKLIIAVNPRLAINEEKFIAEIMDKLNRKKLNITSQIWEQAKVLQLVRAYPKMSKGFKLLPICRLPEQS